MSTVIRLKECLLRLALANLQKQGGTAGNSDLSLYERGKSFFICTLPRAIQNERKDTKMKAQLEQIRRAAKEALASFDSAEQLEKARIQYLGKKGELTAILKQMGKLSAEERPVIGQLANEIRKDIEDTIANKSAEIKKAAQEKRLAEETLDVTMPGTLPQIGYKHPLSIVLDEIKDIFMGMGFDIAEGPEVEVRLLQL